MKMFNLVIPQIMRKILDNKKITSAVKWSILEYSLFVARIVKKRIKFI